MRLVAGSVAGADEGRVGALATIGVVKGASSRVGVRSELSADHKVVAGHDGWHFDWVPSAAPWARLVEEHGGADSVGCGCAPAVLVFLRAAGRVFGCVYQVIRIADIPAKYADLVPILIVV